MWVDMGGYKVTSRIQVRQPNGHSYHQANKGPTASCSNQTWRLLRKDASLFTSWRGSSLFVPSNGTFGTRASKLLPPTSNHPL